MKRIVLSKKVDGKTPVLVNVEHIVYIEPYSTCNQHIHLSTGWVYHNGALDSLLNRINKEDK